MKPIRAVRWQRVGPALLIAALLVAATLLLRALVGGPADETGDVATSEPTTDEGAATPASPLEGATATETRGRSTPVDVDVATADPATSADSSATTPTAEHFTVEGRVVEGRTGAAVPGVPVAFTGRGPSAFAQATTDAEGRFSCLLPHAEWTPYELVGAMVSMRDGFGSIFLGPVVLEPEMLLVARSRLRLHGKLSAWDGFEPTDIWARLEAPRAGTLSVPIFAGTDQLDAWGRFDTIVWVDEVPSSFVVTLLGATGYLFSAPVPTAELTSDTGAVIEAVANRLTVRIVDERDAPIPTAAISLLSVHFDDDTFWYTTRTNEDGEVEFFAPVGEIEVVTGKAGYAFVRRRVKMPPPPDRHVAEIRLLPLADDEVVAGRVLTADDEPLTGAWVSAWPSAEHRNLASSVAVGDLSDARGAFELAIAGNERILVTASHEDHGVSPPVEAQPGGPPLTLRMGRLGALDVRPRDVGSTGGGRSGALEYLLLDEEDVRLDAGHTWGARLDLPEVREGHVDCWLRLAGPGYVGHAATEVRPGKTESLDVPLQPAFSCTGTITDSDGSPLAGLRVRIVTDAWPSAVIDAWGTTTTDGTGRFRIAAAPARAVEAVLRDPEGSARGRLRLDARRDAVHVLR